MRIQNNIMALNTHRQYTIQNDKVSASAEKLSSGYRINRAADDAAGLAISEKMRSQIRGLNQSARNSQDGASLIQTAEGALQEVHSMLQRMNELADQSATGTNAEFDRTQIAKEFDQLKREINDIAEQTTFNNMKILDGSLSVQGFQRSATTVGLYASSLGEKPDVNAVTLTEPAPNANAAREVATFAAGGAVTLDPTAYGTPGTSGDWDGTTVKFTMNVTTADGTFSVTGGTTAIGASSSNEITAAELAATFNGAQLNINGTMFTASADGLTWTSADNKKIDLSGATVNVTAQVVDYVNDDAAGTNAHIDTELGLKMTALASETFVGNGAGTAGARQADYTLDVSKLNVGDTITVGDKTYELVNTLSDTKDGNIGIAWKAGVNDRTLATLQAGMLNANAPTGAAVTIVDGKLHVQQTANDSDASISLSHKSNASQGTQIEFDLVKMKDGDQITVSADGTDYVATYREGDSVDTIYQNLGISTAGQAGSVYVKDNSIILKDIVGEVSFQGATASQEDFGTMRIQVGALEGEQLNIEVKAMNTAGLNLDEHHIYDQDSAGKAITAVRSAIDVVSDQRALLGAMQNRMTYKINNLKIASENLQAAESRIRDVDIASEMTQFTKSNILGQAATAMLAQANSAPQNVLSLLR